MIIANIECDYVSGGWDNWWWYWRWQRTIVIINWLIHSLLELLIEAEEEVDEEEGNWGGNDNLAAAANEDECIQRTG